VAETNFTKFVPPHESAFVNKTVHAADSTFRRVLPHRDVAIVLQTGFVVGILRDHHQIMVEFSLQMFVIEIRTRINERFLLIFVLDHLQKLEKRVAEQRRWQSVGGLNVDHRNQILFLRTTLRTEILQLQLLVGDGAIEMVGTDLQPVTMGKVDVLLECRVDAVAALRRLQIDVGIVGILADMFPKNIALIMAQVDAVNVLASVLALDLCAE